MGLDLKSLQTCRLFFFFFCGWLALSQGTSAPGPCVRISVCTIMQTANHSMTDSHILEKLAQSATKNQAGNKAIKGIKGLKVKDIQPPILYLSFVEKVGISMGVTSQLTIAGKSFIGGTMEITLKSNMTTLCKMTVKNHDVTMMVMKCSVELISCKTNLPSSMLPKIVNKFLNSTLSKVLPGMMCPAADQVVEEMQKKMGEMWAPQPFGVQGSAQYHPSGSPEITTDHARICFETQITRSSGEKIEIPSEPSAMEVLPELESKNSELTFPVNVLNAAMELYKQDLDQEVTSETVEGGPGISSDALKEMVPTLELPETSGDLKFKMRCTSTPTWSLEVAVATLTVSLSIELVAGSEETSMFLLSVELKSLATFKVVHGTLQPSLGDTRLENMQEVSTTLGTSDLEPLSNYLLDLIRVTTVPALEKALQDGIPLPSMMGTDYGDAVAETEILKDTLRVVLFSNCE